MEVTKATKLHLRKFIATAEGASVLEYLKDCAPTIGKGEPHAMIFDAGYASGYAKAISNIMNLLEIKEKAEADYENK